MVHKLQVTGLCIRLDAVTVLIHILGSLFIALEDTVGLDQIEGVEWFALSGLNHVRNAAERLAVGPYTRCTVGILHADIRYPVLQPSEVAGYEVAEVLVELVFPAQLNFQTAVAHLTLVDEHGVDTDGAGPIHGLHLNQVERTLLEVVH